MREFYLNILGFFCICFFITFLVLIIYYDGNIIQKASLPPPYVTNSISLNEKILASKNVNPKVISIGSSMTLNNLSSRIIQNSCGFQSYYNYGSWGMTPIGTLVLLEVLLQKFDIDTIVISTYMFDFHQRDFDIDKDNLLDFLNSNSLFVQYIKNFNGKYILDNLDWIEEARKNNKHYKSLKFDSSGGVIYSKENFKVDEKRWNDTWSNYEIDSNNYLAFQKICEMCALNNIDLHVFNSPLRNGLLDSIDNEKFDRHIDRLEGIVNQAGFNFIDASEVLWEDSLYVDGIHLDSIGAEKYTSYCLNKI